MQRYEQNLDTENARARSSDMPSYSSMRKGIAIGATVIAALGITGAQKHFYDNETGRDKPVTVSVVAGSKNSGLSEIVGPYADMAGVDSRNLQRDAEVISPDLADGRVDQGDVVNIPVNQGIVEDMAAEQSKLEAENSRS